MSMHSDEVIIQNVPLPIDGGNATAVKVDGSVSVSGSVNVGNVPATQPISGTVSVGNFPATQPVSGSVSIVGTVPVTTGNASASTVAQVALSMNVNTTLLSANANRKKIILFAPKTTLYIKLGATASATSFSYIVSGANTTIEITGWGGQVDVLSTSNQSVNVTELV